MCWPLGRGPFLHPSVPALAVLFSGSVPGSCPFPSQLKSASSLDHFFVLYLLFYPVTFVICHLTYLESFHLQQCRRLCYNPTPGKEPCSLLTFLLLVSQYGHIVLLKFLAYGGLISSTLAEGHLVLWDLVEGSPRFLRWDLQLQTLIYHPWTFALAHTVNPFSRIAEGLCLPLVCPLSPFPFVAKQLPPSQRARTPPTLHRTLIVWDQLAGSIALVHSL